MRKLGEEKSSAHQKQVEIPALQYKGNKTPGFSDQGCAVLVLTECFCRSFSGETTAFKEPFFLRLASSF